MHKNKNNAKMENMKMDDNSQETPQYETFEDFISQAGEPARDLYEKHTAGLKSALDSERNERKALSATLKELQGKAEKGSALEAELSGMAKKLEDAERRSAESEKRAIFVEQALRPDVSCSNVKAAYALAVNESLFKSNGEPDWAELKKVAPELFRTAGKTNAGATGRGVSDEMNNLIRKAAGII